MNTLSNSVICCTSRIQVYVLLDKVFETVRLLTTLQVQLPFCVGQIKFSFHNLPHDE